MSHAQPTVADRVQAFDKAHAAALRRLWILGDVHGHFTHVERALATASELPAWLLFVGDLDLEQQTFREVLGQLLAPYLALRAAFIYGNHDADTHENWARLHDCAPAVPLHGKVLDLEGVRVAGLDGIFIGRIWYPPEPPRIERRRNLQLEPLLPHELRKPPSPKLAAAIYPDDATALATQSADILITHEAPSCHHHGFEEIDDLARALGVVRAFHGHHHDDLSDEYAPKREALGFDARAVGFCSIKNGLGEMIWEMDVERGHA